MTPEQAKKLAPIIAAFGEGKRVQWFDSGTDTWVAAYGNPGFSVNVEWRIAPQPVKLWVATWFDSGFERGVAAWCSSDKNEAMRYSARPGFKLHELD